MNHDLRRISCQRDMAHNFNNFSVSTDGRVDNVYGELTNSLIFPNAFQVSPGFQQNWQPSPGWQNNGQGNYTMGNPFQGQVTGQNSFFPIQQDYVAFDEGEDFYNNEEEDTSVGQEEKVAQQKNGLPPQAQTSGHQSTSISGHTLSGSIPSTRVEWQGKGMEQQKENVVPSTTAQDRAAELRAKLLAQKQAAGKTPTPEPRTVTKPSNGDAKVTGTATLKTSSPIPRGNSAFKNQPRASQIAQKASAFFDSKKDDKSNIKPNIPLSQPSHTSTDIDALLAEARDNATLPNQNKAGPINTELQKSEKTDENPKEPTNAKPAEKQPPVNSKSPEPKTIPPRRESPRNSKAPSETSEQGEIREEPKPLEQSSTTKTLIETVPSQQPAPSMETKAQGGASKKARNSPKGVKNSAQQPKKIDTSLANGGRKAGSGPTSAKPKSPTVVKTPASSRPTDSRDPPPTSDFRDSWGSGSRYTPRDRYGDPPWQGPDRQQGYDRGRPYVRDSRQYDSYRAPLREDTITRSERDASEHKRNLNVEHVETREVVMQETSPRQAEPVTIEKDAAYENINTLTNPETAEYYKDLDEWLDWTGYHDKEYRVKQLALRRRMIELDEMRMEIEREAHAGFEARSQLNRAQSVRSRASSTIGSTPAPPPRYPSFSMPPPPIPSKEDVPMQPKDLAIRQTTITTARSDDVSQTSKQTPPSSTTLTVAGKRQYPSDEIDERSVPVTAKIARTDARDFSSDKPPQLPMTNPRVFSGSLESRISVDDGAYPREYAQQRSSRSSEYRRRSISPSSRRASGPEPFMSRQFSRGLRNGYSPNRRPEYSRDNSPNADGGISYDDTYEGNQHGRYPAYRYDYDNRTNIGYDHYGTNGRGGLQTGVSANRARGRRRGSRGPYPAYRGAYSQTFNDAASK